MRLLFVDNDAQSARRLHGEFLDYRGVNWSLTHCHDTQAAIKHWERDSFQCLLLRISAGIEQATLELNEWMQVANCPPILAISDHLTNDEQLQLMISGADDCLHRGESNGASIMRHLRMAELRSAVWSKQSTVLQDCDGEELANFLASSNSGHQACCTNHISQCQCLRVAHVGYGSTLLNVTTGSQADLQFTRFSTLESLIDVLDENPYALDAMVVEQSVFEKPTSQRLAN